MAVKNRKEFSGEKKQNRQPGVEQEMAIKPVYINPSYRGSGKLEGKKAIVTGGDSGIGRAICIHFAREGADVAIIYLNEHEDAKETKKLVEEEGRKCLLLPGDLSDPVFCKKSIAKAVKQLGGLNILVNNAAQHYPQENFKNISLKQLDHTFKTNVYPYFFLTGEALNHLKAGDSIINTTSVTAYRGSAHLIDYASTKGAIVSFIRSLGANLAGKNIRVNGVAPGPIWTPLIVSSFGEEEIRVFGQDTPMGRAGQPAEVAPAYVFLASEDASYVTAQVLHVNGGEPVNG